MPNIVRMVKAENYTVFLSYSSDNLGVAELLFERIEREGAKCLFDRNSIPPGEQFEEMIVANIRKSHQLLILLTPEFATSNWLFKEYGIALGADIPICAVIERLSAENMGSMHFT